MKHLKPTVNMQLTVKNTQNQLCSPIRKIYVVRAVSNKHYVVKSNNEYNPS